MLLCLNWLNSVHNTSVNIYLTESLLLKLTKVSFRHYVDNLPVTHFAFCGQSQTLNLALNCRPAGHFCNIGTPLLHIKKLEQSAAFGSITVYSNGSTDGQLPRGKPWALTSDPKHARRAGNISDAINKPETYNKRTTKTDSSLAFVTLFFSFLKNVKFHSRINFTKNVHSTYFIKHTWFASVCLSDYFMIVRQLTVVLMSQSSDKEIPTVRSTL
jgi:hypothetical protein